MYRSRTGLWAVTTLVLAALLAGCSADPQTEAAREQATAERENRFRDCLELADDITATLQSYLDQFAPDGAVDGSIGAQPQSTADLQTAADTFRRRRVALGCGVHEFRVLLDVALEDLDGSGPLARAIEAQLRNVVFPPIGPAADVTVEPGDDLAAAVHGAHPDVTVRLAPGRHELDEPLLLLRPATLVGAGSDRTTIVSGAPGAVVVHLGQETFSADGIRFLHEGDEEASVVVLSNGSYRLDDVTVEGGVGGADGAGWGLVLGSGQDRVENRVEDARGLVLLDNAVGGMAVVDRNPTITDVVATGNTGCGVCFLGAAGGTLDQVEVRDNDIGLSIGGDSAPSVSALTADGNRASGVIANDRAETRLDGATITSNGALGVRVQDAATLTITEATIAGHGEVGVLVEADGTLELTEGSVSEVPAGVAVRGAAAATVSDVVVSGVEEANVVFGGTSTGSVGELTCAEGVPGVVLLEQTSVEVLDATCPVFDQR